MLCYKRMARNNFTRCGYTWINNYYVSIVAALKYRSIRWRNRLPAASRSRDIAIEILRACDQHASAFASSLGGISAALERKLPADPLERLRVALFASVIVHAAVVLG